MQLTKISTIEKRLKEIQNSAISKDYNVYLFILGNQTKETITSLPDRVGGVSLLWSGWGGPKWMKIIFFFIAGYGGLYKLVDRKKLTDLALEASSGGLIQIVVSQDSIDQKFIQVITKNGVNPHIVHQELFLNTQNMLVSISCDQNEMIGSEQAGLYKAVGKN